MLRLHAGNHLYFTKRLTTNHRYCCCCCCRCSQELRRFQKQEAGYQKIQSTKPQTLAYALQVQQYSSTSLSVCRLLLLQWVTAVMA